MVCVKCKKEITEVDKSIVIQYLTICKDCSKEIAYICHTCHEPIYKNELVYEVSPNWSAEYIFGASQSEKVIQCGQCHREWLFEQKIKAKWWSKRKWVLGICSSLLLSIIFFWLYPTLEENWIKLFYREVDGKQVFQTWKPLIVCSCILGLSFFITYALYRMISLEFIDRHKDRRRNKKKIRRKTKKIKQTWTIKMENEKHAQTAVSNSKKLKC